jgi:hypothetical protein
MENKSVSNQTTSNEELKATASKTPTVTNIFNFTGDSSSINIGDFNFPGNEKNTAEWRSSNSLIKEAGQEKRIDLNKPYGSFTCANEADVIVQLPPDYDEAK